MLDIIKNRVGLGNALYTGMTLKIGTIHEMTGQGYEILVDQETRSYVLAKFFDGKFIDSHSVSAEGVRSEDPTVAPTLAS